MQVFPSTLIVKIIIIIIIMTNIIKVGICRIKLE